MSQSNFNSMNKISINDLAPEVQLILQLATGSGESLKGIYPGATKTENVGNGKIKINDVEVTVYSHPSSHPASIITGLSAVATSGKYTDLTDTPTSLPASDVYPWAKASTKPTYSASDVGAIPSNTKGASNGVASLDSLGKIPVEQLLDNLVDLALNGKVTASQLPNIEIPLTNVTNDNTTITIFGGLNSSKIPKD